MMRWSRGEALLVCGHTYDYVLILDYKCTVDVKDVFWSAEGKERAVCSATRAFPWVDCIRGGKVTFDHWKLPDWQGLFSTFCLIHGLVTRIARESLLSLSLSLFNRVNHDRPVFDAREGFNMRLLDRKDQASLQTKIFICMYLYIFFNKLQLNSTLIFPEDSTRKIATRSWFSMETIA